MRSGIDVKRGVRIGVGVMMKSISPAKSRDVSFVLTSISGSNDTAGYASLISRTRRGRNVSAISSVMPNDRPMDD
ncbi:hypothetical protein OKW41_003840 [Paraburkholderia sp. UCT70]